MMNAEIDALVAEKLAMRETIKRLNRRAQEAEAALSDYHRCLHHMSKKGSAWCGGNLGRALLAWDNSRLRRVLHHLEVNYPEIAAKIGSAGVCDDPNEERSDTVILTPPLRHGAKQ